MPSISADGLTVAFASPATNLVTADGNHVSDVFSVHVDQPLPPFGVHRIRASVNETITDRNFALTNPPPEVVSIVPDVTSTTGTSLNFTVTFSETVTGVDPTDFAMVTTGTAAATVAQVMGVSDTYTVSLDVSAGEGTLALQLIDNDSIVDVELTPLAGPTVDGGATSAEVIVDSIAPSVLRSTRLTLIQRATLRCVSRCNLAKRSLA